MTCNCCNNLHKTTGLTAAGVLTVTNPNNIGNFDEFCLLLTINPNSVVTTSPVAYTVTVNGTSTPIVDIWGYPITTDRLRTRKIYHGKYILIGTTPHITLTNVPCDASTAAAAVANTNTTNETDGD